MDPVSGTILGLTAAELALGSAAVTAAGTGVAAIGQYQAAQAQGDADRQRAAIESQWAERRATDERAAAQRSASDEMRKARYAQSRLTAMVGGSGAGADDPTVMDLFGDIEKEGRLNAANATAAGEQKATGMEYQSALGEWAAANNARIRDSAGTTTLISGLLSSTGQLAGGMARRYGGRTGGGYGAYG